MFTATDHASLTWKQKADRLEELLNKASRLADEINRHEGMPATLEPSDVHLRVICQTHEAVYLRLSAKLQRPIDGGCDCGKCSGVPMWDTLVVPTKWLSEWAYTVHLPDAAISEFKEHTIKRGLARSLEVSR